MKSKIWMSTKRLLRGVINALRLVSHLSEKYGEEISSFLRGIRNIVRGKQGKRNREKKLCEEEKCKCVLTWKNQQRLSDIEQ